jgi:nitroreductase
MNAIFERRSTRKYTDKVVTFEIIEKLLEAGMCAPSAGNERPWQFIVIDNKDTLSEITKFHPYSQMLKIAQYAIVVCGDLSLLKYEGFWVQDCSAAAENMLIMAQELGLGSVWLGVYPLEDRIKALSELLGLPENVTPLSILPIGYPAEKKIPKDRFDRSRIHRNQW